MRRLFKESLQLFILKKKKSRASEQSCKSPGRMRISHVTVTHRGVSENYQDEDNVCKSGDRVSEVKNCYI